MTARIYLSDDQGVEVDLDPDLIWTDELTWTPVAQSTEYSVTGALIIQAGSRKAGRPVTLAPDGDSSAWMSRAQLQQLEAWLTVPGKKLHLHLESRGMTLPVLFRHEDVGREASPVVAYSDPANADWYRATIRLIEVA